jgi:class 3 adenylate cyclase
MLGAGETRLFDVIGDTINVAKRLCDAAKAGEMIVSEAVVGKLQSDALQSESQVSLDLKGKGTLIARIERARL